MKYHIKFPSLADGTDIEFNTTMQAIAYAINWCKSEDFYQMSDECPDGDGLYIDILNDEDPDDFTTVAFIHSKVNGDDYDIFFEDEADITHTIRKVSRDYMSSMFVVDNNDFYDYDGNPIPKPSALYSVLEEHIDGSLWYHPGWTYYSECDAKELIEQKQKQDLWQDRSMTIFTHEKPLPQDRSTWTIDMVNFHDRSGAFIWNIDKGLLS